MSTKKQAARLAAASRKAARAAVKALEVVRQYEAGLLATGVAFTRDGIEYVVNRDGRAVRQPTKDAPVTREECVHLLLNARVVEEGDVLEALGPNVHKWMLDKGLLRRDARNRSLLWVTKAAASQYGLPRPVVAGKVCNFV